MADIEMKVVGFDQLITTLKQFGPKVERQLVQAALLDAGQPMLERARALVPKDSGFLARELKLRRIRNRGGKVRVMLTTRTKRPKTAVQRQRIRKARARAKAAGMKVSSRRLDFGFYSHFLEFGTKKMAPQPFMRPALAGSRQLFVSRFEGAMRQGIEGLLMGRTP